MIISASYRTDIPAFYGRWFMDRLRAGFCSTLNPYNRRPIHIPLTRDTVDGFVFWTKNLAPFLPHLPAIARRGFPFVIQYAIHGYPRPLEISVTDARRSVANLRRVADDFGPRICVWRYDPILATTLTPLDFHRRNFEALARELEGATDEVVISFAQIYRKTERNLTLAGAAGGFAWSDPPDEQKLALVQDLVAIARSRGMRLAICSQPQYLVPGAGEARCIDADRFAAITGVPLATREKGNRPTCRCHESRDIGDYDTCPHGCVYCYAVASPARAKQRFLAHDPESPFLHAPAQSPPAADRSLPLLHP